MGILQIPTVLPGQVGILPQRKSMVTTDNLATVTTAGYLNQFNLQGNPVSTTDVIEAFYSFNPVTNVGTFSVFTVSISNGVITLVEDVAEGNVVLPTTANHIATYVGTNGQITEDPAAAINFGNIQAGASGHAGGFTSYSSAANTGYLFLSATANAGNTATNITNVAMGQATTLFITDPLSSSGSFLVCQNPVTDPGANLISVDVVVGHTALASGGSVTIYPSSGLKEYYIRNIFLNSNGTNFSGGGGDRLGQITDGIKIWSVIPAANMQALTNAAWGSTALPFPASIAINSQTDPGAAIVFKYSGGTTDYSAGSLVITMLLERFN